MECPYILDGYHEPITSQTGTPSGVCRLYMVYTAALPRVSVGSVVLSRHEGPYELKKRAVDENTLQKNKFQKSGLFNNGFYGQDIVMAFSPPEYCRLGLQGLPWGGHGHPRPPPPPPSYAPEVDDNMMMKLLMMMVMAMVVNIFVCFHSRINPGTQLQLISVRTIKWKTWIQSS